MRDPTPILFVDHAQAMGGAEGMLLTVCQHLDKARWRPVLACNGQLLERAQSLGLASYPVGLPRLRRSAGVLGDLWGGMQQLHTLAKNTRARLVYANTVRSMFYAVPTVRLAGIPLVWHMHDFWLSEARPRFIWVDHLLKRLLHSQTSRVIAISAAVAGQLPGQKHITVVPNAIEVDRFDAALDGAPFRTRYSLSASAPLTGMIARLRPWKGQRRFLKAMAHIAQAMPDARFLVVGGEIFGGQDTYEQELRKLVGQLGLGDQVIFSGHLSDVRPAIAAMDVFVHPGDPEPFGLVNIEAMAMGKPVVAFAHGALPEIVVDGTTGILVPPGDESALAETVLELLRDPARRITMGAAGRERVEKHFNVQRAVSEIENILGEVAR